MEPSRRVNTGEDLRISKLLVELNWIRRRAYQLIKRGIARREAINQAVEEQMAFERYDEQQQGGS